MYFSLHYSIKYFKNNNCFPSILNLFSVNASFSKRFPEKCSRFHANAGHYKEELECSFHSRKYWSRVTWIDCQNYMKAASPCQYLGTFPGAKNGQNFTSAFSKKKETYCSWRFNSWPGCHDNST